MRILTALFVLALSFPFKSNATETDAGRKLFSEGDGAMALLAGGEVKVDANGFACANCHGGDALGRSEGGTDFPPINWSALADPSRAEGAYEINSFMRAVRDGVGVDGRQLSNAMPRYEVDTQRLEALANFLDRLDVEERKGISSANIAIGFPDNSEQYQLFDMALSEANASGGAWGRRFTMARDESSLIDWQEAQKRLTQAINRAHQTAVTNYLLSASIGSVQVPSGGERWRQAMTRAGIKLNSDAPNRLIEGEAGPELVIDNKPGSIVFQLRSPVSASQSRDSGQYLSKRARRAYVIGTTLADVIMDCGRAVTRACVRERLDNADLSVWMEKVRSEG